MLLCSTNNKNIRISFKDAVIKGIAEDGGLFMPVSIPRLSSDFYDSMSSKSFVDIAYYVSKELLQDEISLKDLKKVIDHSITFDAPLTQLDQFKYVLELYHGPTLAFKDFGSRFMANIFALLRGKKEITILVATSGDTGSAVANGFLNVDGIKVVLLYPAGKVSKIQEQQLTTLDGNITSVEVDGNFDDCQRLVKQAFADKQLNETLNLSSANSINIARLIPQSFYYFYAYAQLEKLHDGSLNDLVISVPSGNFGNLTAGLIAYQMGLPVNNFIAAVNSNDVFPNYLFSGYYRAKPSIRTISNAMDVGNPSNFARLTHLFNNDFSAIKSLIKSYSFSDDETRDAIKEVYEKYNYIIDPHGAVGYLGLKKYENENIEKSFGIILETAHPAKFKDTVDDVLEIDLPLPEELASCLNKGKHSILMSNNFNELKKYLLDK
jgi:threonine synthase